MKKICLVVLVFFSVSLSGCAETKLLERVGLTTLIGFDLGKEERVETTAIVRQVGTESQSNVAIITAENKSINGTILKIDNRAAEKTMPGQMRVVLFGEELAQDGIEHYINVLLENPTISDGIFLAVVKGDAKSLLEFKYPDTDEIGEHIYKLLKQNIESEDMISSTLNEVANSHYSVGKDIAVPIISREKELVEISGIALFNKGKMVGKLPVGDSVYLQMIQDRQHRGKHELTIEGDDVPSSLMENPSAGISIVFDPIQTRRTLKIVNSEKPEFSMDFTLQARILEVKPYVNIGDAEKVKELAKAINKSVEKKILKVIAHCQEAESDVFGFGEFYRSTVRHSNLTEEKWHEMYDELKVNVSVDFQLNRNGVFE
ncbi:spore gernimation protein [Sporosarcina sp. P16b]|uniref:Ger(x)C family spore germination protein n=1 Tax=Sporosarcina sp. P16b TaxID=2048261 RepID=UPI000C17261C|nr:Ger(x)C family spore germination protein [Sporosarcina sp. P16b]PIC69857.1 spore gernimation protein [Sporosarcina sp. P16b]